MSVRRPTRDDAAGRAYLDLRRKARADGRATDEYLRLYVLEAFLARLAGSGHDDNLILKGGVLLAAYAVRRPTADVDIAANEVSGQVEPVRALVSSVAARAADDGVVFDTSAVRAERIRDEDQYAGVRVTLTAQLATAVVRFHVDVNIGDPISPAPGPVRVPRLLGGEITVRGYPLEMVLAEKVVTAIERGTVNTRWRDFADIYLLSNRHSMPAVNLAQAIRAVAEHRSVTVQPLRQVLVGYAELAQNKWVAWRRRQMLDGMLPERFEDVLTAASGFADPILESADTRAGLTWHHLTQRWIGDN